MGFIEWLITEGMKTPYDIPPGYVVRIIEDYDHLVIYVGARKKGNDDVSQKLDDVINLIKSIGIAVTPEDIQSGTHQGRPIDGLLQSQYSRTKDQRIREVLLKYNQLRKSVSRVQQATDNNKPLKALVRTIVVKTNYDGEEVYVPHNTAVQGWGPLGYDLAIEYATMHGSCVIPATGARAGMNTKYSRAVWKYYYENRSDVRKEPLENTYHYDETSPYLYCRYFKDPVFLNQLQAMNRQRPGFFTIGPGDANVIVPRAREYDDH